MNNIRTMSEFLLEDNNTLSKSEIELISEFISHVSFIKKSSERIGEEFKIKQLKSSLIKYKDVLRKLESCKL